LFAFNDLFTAGRKLYSGTYTQIVKLGSIVTVHLAGFTVHIVVLVKSRIIESQSNVIKYQGHYKDTQSQP